MKLNATFLILLILLVLSKSDDVYEKLINEEVSEEYCTAVISNITKLLEEGYVYLEYYKSPKKLKGNEIYDIEVLDLIEQLEDIPRTNRKFYDFYRDIVKIIKKTGDNHLSFTAGPSPINRINLKFCYYHIPFIFKAVDELDENGDFNDTYLVISKPYANYKPTGQDYDNYLNKKIFKINDIDPFAFVVNLFGPFSVGHNSQINYVQTLEISDNLDIIEYPFLKEELSNIKLEFENGDEYTFNYTFNYLGGSNFIKYYNKRIERDIPFGSPFINIRKIYKEYKQYKEAIDPKYKPKRKIDTIDWDYECQFEYIKCKVDEVNKKNVMIQVSFSPLDIENYQETMLKCLDSFYSNNYEIILIESRNPGGYGNLCFPLTQYLRPKIRGFCPSSSKYNFLNYESELMDGKLEYETCQPIDSYEKLNRGVIDNYGEAIHNRTKEVIFFNIYSQNEMENNRKKFATKNTKKPTEIIIFTDGYTFSCGSILIKNMQVYGSAIIVGYMAHTNITDKKDFDASQSNSAVSTFRSSQYTKNLRTLGFDPSITYMEQFDPNDKEDPKIPMEFRKYPVDELSDIHEKYSDDIYDRFIKAADKFFKKYNEDKRCNPDNKFLFYETDKCDSELNVEHGHGGYICNDKGVWDTDNCVLKYCDEEYILDIKNNKCIKAPCDNFEIKNITVNCDENLDYEIEPNTGYIFNVKDENDENCSLHFFSEYENFFYAKSGTQNLKSVENGTEVSNGESIFSNLFLNNSENVKILIRNTSNAENINNEEEEKNATYIFFRRKKSSGLSTVGIVLISILMPLAVIGTIIATIVLTRKTAINTHIKSLNSDASLRKF